MTAPRKYFTESVLNVYSSEPAMVAPANLDKITLESDEHKEQLRNSNIYLILKRPRISFIPQSLRLDNREVVGELSVHLGDTTSTHPFLIRGALPESVLRVSAAQYPYTKLTLRGADEGQEMIYPIAYLMRHMEVALNGIDDQEVVYVGQAFGNAGERSAVERLSSHSTLQKILADITANEPNMEVLLALYCFEYHRFIMNMDGKAKPEVDHDDDQAHYNRILDSDLERSMRISVAEAALIKHFEPKYNKVYKADFPQQRHKILETLYDLDFVGIVVEASVADHGMRLRSAKQKPRAHHIAKFDLHDKAARRSFFFDEL